MTATVTDLGARRDAKLVGTTHPGRLRIIVKALSVRPDLLTPAETAKLAAAKRLMERN